MRNASYPLPLWWDFTVSGPTLPDFYWNVKSQEERIKKICEDLWKLIQLYKMLVDAINDHEERIQELERKVSELYNLYQQLLQRVENIEDRLETLEETINQLIQNLPDMIRNLIEQYIDSEEFVDKIEEIVNSLIANKMDKVPNATEDNVAIFDDEGGVKDSGVNLSSKVNTVPNATEDNVAIFDDNGNIKDSGVGLSSKMDKVPSATSGNLASYDANGQVVDSGIDPSNLATTSDLDGAINGVQGNVPIFDSTGHALDDSGKEIENVTTGCYSSSKIPTSSSVRRTVLKSGSINNVFDSGFYCGTAALNITIGTDIYIIDAFVVYNLYNSDPASVTPNVNTIQVAFARRTDGYYANPDIALIARNYDVANSQWGDWVNLGHEYIQCNDATTALAMSQAHPNALCYVPET